VESNPLSEVEWTFENKTLNEGNHGVLQSNYTILRAKCVDTGFYMCTATNIINMESYSDKRVVQLSVKCKYIVFTSVLLNVADRYNMTLQICSLHIVFSSRYILEILAVLCFK
jgi:hypothetical protein